MPLWGIGVRNLYWNFVHVALNSWFGIEWEIKFESSFLVDVNETSDTPACVYETVNDLLGFRKCKADQ